MCELMHLLVPHVPTRATLPFAVSLRLQLTEKSGDAGGKAVSPFVAFAEYVTCALILSLAVLNFMG